MIRLLHGFVKWLACRLPASWVESLVLTAINARADSLPPAEGLRLLLHLDNRLYESTSRLGIAFEQGSHPKLRITRYHDFFARRIGAGERVLDVGCGQGALAFAIASRAGAHVTGMDLSSENVAKAVARYAHPDLEYRIGDALKLQIDQPFDVVVLSNVLEHLPGRPEFLSHLCASAGKPRFLIRVPLIDRDWRVPLKRELGIEWRADPTHETEYTLDSFACELKEAGLDIVEQLVCWGEIWAVAKAKEGPPS